MRDKMLAGICATCAELVESPRGCPRCGAELARGRQDILAWEWERQRHRIGRWVRAGVIDDATGRALVARIVDVDGPRDANAGAHAHAGAQANANVPAHASPSAGGSRIEQGADAAVGAASALLDEMSERWKRLAKAIDEDAPERGHDATESLQHDDRTTAAGRVLFAEEGRSAVVGAGLEALAGLDARSDHDARARPRSGEPEAPSRPFGALQVFWFIGTVLVLAGSVMGVREAWRTLEGVWRPVVIASAFFAYHVLFVALSRLLVRRSAITGRVLAGISAGLLPVVFVAAAVAIEQLAAVGVPFAVALLVGSVVSLLFVGRIAESSASGVALATGLAPALFLELALGSGGATDERRGALVLVALVPAALAATRARASASAASMIGLAAGAYGAIAVAILGFYGGPGDPALPWDDIGMAPRLLVGWVALAAAIGWWASSGPAIVARLTGHAAVPFVLSLAALVSASAAALVMGLAQADAGSPASVLGLARHVPLLVLLLAIAVLVVEQRARPAVLHVTALVALATMLLVAKTVAPSQGGLWAPLCAVVPAAFLLLGVLVSDRRRRAILASWGMVLGVITLFATMFSEGASRTSADALQPWMLTCVTAASLALAAHAGAKLTRPSLHVMGALFAFVAVMAWLLPTAGDVASGASAWPLALMWGCAGLGVLYGAAALGYATFASKDDERRPLDDVSLLFAGGGVVLGMLAPSGGDGSARAAAPALALALILFARALRDRSALVVAMGAVGLGLAAALLGGFRAASAEESVWFFGLLSGVFAVLASARAPREADAPRFGRAIYGLVPLPLSGGPRTLLDGFALVSLGCAALAVLPAMGWLGVAPLSRTEPGRTMVLAGLGGVLGVAALAFGTRAFDRFRARGSAITLGAAAPVVALAAVAYRIGRPLPPEVVGVRLTAVVAVVWLLARGLVKAGPRIALAIAGPGHEREGKRYHHVAHAGVLALALVLFVDAVLVGGPTPTRAAALVPPLLLAGSALGALLLYRSYGSEPLLHLGLLLFGGATFLGFAQRSPLGVPLVALDPPGGRWVPSSMASAARADWLEPARFLASGDSELALWNRGWFGLAVASALFGALLFGMSRSSQVGRAVRAVLAREEEDMPSLQGAVATSLCATTLLVACALALQPSLPAALSLALAAVLAALALAPSYRSLPLVVAAPLLVHSLTQAGTLVPSWAGPAMALLALGAVLVGMRVSASRGRDPSILVKTQLVALAYVPMALAYAACAGGTTSAVNAAPHVVELALASAFSPWGVSFAPALTLLVLAVATGAASLTWRGALARLFFVTPPLVLGASGLGFASAFTGLSGPDGAALLVTREGPLAALTLAVAAAVAHLTAMRAAATGRDDAKDGLSVGRDVVLVASALVMCLFVGMRTPGGFLEGPCGVLALGLLVVVSVHAVAWQGTARHVAFVETLVVALYAFATRSLDLRPEVDAMLGLLYGFSLLGVAVIARRRNVEGVANATRRVAAVLPLAIAIFTLRGANDAAAGFALGTSVLYGAMAWATRSRAFGSLAALAANLALVIFAVAQGLEGVEIYIGPLGIFVTALAQIFAPKMTPAARGALRVIGGVLLYLPAGVKLTFQLGAAEDASYAVVFGAACLLGAFAGLVLRVRAYLALGTLFLTLDVMANLVHAGLRDHRIGFVLLSATGLLILGGMIAITLRRDRAWAALGLVRSRLRAWD